MFRVSESTRQKRDAIMSILFRNVFLLVNAIIGVVVIFLILFGDVREGIFLGSITVLNMIIGTAQETKAWWTLQKLQSLTAPRALRIEKDGSEHSIHTEEVEKNDRIQLKTGDQVPCDGHLVSSHGFEVNEALITGESRSSLRVPGGKLLAGGIVTSGSGVLEVEETFANSRIAQMTKSVKKFSLNFSPIQIALNKIIKYSSYLLILIIFFVTVRGYVIHQLPVDIVKNVGALTSLLLPQGMVVIMTLIFAFGASNLYRKNILLQEINAVEKIGRIKNLCMDKTGTLTDNNLEVREMHLAEGVTRPEAEQAATAYIKGSNDASLMMNAIGKFVNTDFEGVIVEDLSFSSTRQFGAVRAQNDDAENCILVGAPDILLSQLISSQEKEWLKNIIETETKIGNRIVFFTEVKGGVIPSDLSKVQLSAIAVFVLSNNLREGVKDAIDFFQKRGVVIRIISGDNPDTVRAVAESAGVKNTGAVITGPEIEGWSAEDFIEKTKGFTIFARVKPLQKEKLIEALKHDGFTAMVGDGANDAVAIKKSDLGVAMFDGAVATRQIASIVLTKNSFGDLPNGVKLADSVIENIEICASIFFNQIIIGFLFFISLIMLGYSFPFTPLNITFINYFAIGLPTSLIFYWIIRSRHAHLLQDPRPFLKRVLPFAAISALPQTILVVFAFYASIENTKITSPTSLVILAFILAGLIFFTFTPRVYAGVTTDAQKKQFFALIVLEIVSFLFLVKIPFIDTFYNLKSPSLLSVLELAPLALIYAVIQYILAKWFSQDEIASRNIRKTPTNSSL
ncbi:MAG: HAD-IC family P-type ATPase [Candidatus Taylorbacteria bacterium]